MYVHTCCVPFVFLGVLSSWHLQLACLHLKCICLAFQSMLLHERAQRAEPLYRYTAAAVQQLCVRVCMLSLNREHSKAQHGTAQSPLHKAANKYLCRSEYVSKGVCTYMHAASRLFSWSVELLALTSRLFAPKMLDHLSINTTPVIPIHSSL